MVWRREMTQKCPKFQKCSQGVYNLPLPLPSFLSFSLSFSSLVGRRNKHDEKHWKHTYITMWRVIEEKYRKVYWLLMLRQILFLFCSKEGTRKGILKEGFFVHFCLLFPYFVIYFSQLICKILSSLDGKLVFYSETIIWANSGSKKTERSSLSRGNPRCIHKSSW